MRRSLVVGILREGKQYERRAPITPKDVEWLIKRGIQVEVESSPYRIYSDEEYRRCGASVLPRLRRAVLLVGIKHPALNEVYDEKIYMIFSHTMKGQKENLPFLKACLKKRITLIDYEKITDKDNKRLVYFGRFAGICGMVDTLHYMAKKIRWQGIKNPFEWIRPAYEYGSVEYLKEDLFEVNKRICNRGLPDRITPFVIGITGHGNVSRGVQEILDVFEPIEIHPRNMLKFIRQKRKDRRRIYKIVFLREEKLRSKDGKAFYFEEYLNAPDRFESNLDVYLPYLNVLVHTSYWDSRFPRMVTKRMVHSLSKRRPFRLEFIGDISCDVNGSIELTYKTTTPDNPTYTYNYRTHKYSDGYHSDGITILAVDNLPSEIPKDASEEFSSLIRDYVYQISAHGILDVTNHIALPVEIRQAVVTQAGRITPRYNYLKEYL